MIDGNCEGCYYAAPNFDSDANLVMKCRRYPPVVFLDGEGEATQTWPDAYLRCGEYKAEVEVELKPNPFEGLMRLSDSAKDVLRKLAEHRDKALVCSTCDGTGATTTDEEGYWVCSDCGGSGLIGLKFELPDIPEHLKRMVQPDEKANGEDG